jgi:protein associated with RNAse G/E
MKRGTYILSAFADENFAILIHHIFHALNIAGRQSIFARNPASGHFSRIRISFIKSIEIQKRIKIMWKRGDVIVWRGIYRNRVWHAQPVIVVKDTPEEIAVTLLPGTDCVAPEGYLDGKDSNKRRWSFKDKDWGSQNYLWRTNRLLILLEPQKYYSTMYFWQEDNNEFLCYYINFQLPFQRSHYGIDTLDLDLDIIINPDFTWHWKDVEDYQKAIDNGVIFPEWTREIDTAKQEIFGKLEKRQYPYDGSWLNWMPNPAWSPPKLPENWDKI